jgi:hypothetical protein
MTSDDIGDNHVLRDHGALLVGISALPNFDKQVGYVHTVNFAAMISSVHIFGAPQRRTTTAHHNKCCL